MDEVQAWSKDLQILQVIKGQKYRILIDVYTGEDLDMIDDWIEKIANENKVMETLHDEIHRLKDQAWEWILEVEKLYSDACLDIFEDEEQEKLLLVEVVVEKFRKTLDKVASDEDIRQAFRIEEALLELDTKLGDFVKTWIKVDNYH